MKRMIAGLAFSVLAAYSALADINPKDGLSGAEVNQIVYEALQAQGISADPQIAMVRSFPGCDDIPSVSKKYDDWATVELNCSNPSAWTRAVRTQIGSQYQANEGSTTQVSGTFPAVVLAESLSRGTVLMPEHLKIENVSKSSTDSIFYDPNHIIGRRLTVNLGEGRAVLARHLEKEWLVYENNPVAIVYSGGVFAVTATGEALQDGQLGDLIDVRNTGSGLMIKAIVAGRNKVLVSAKMN